MAAIRLTDLDPATRRQLEQKLANRGRNIERATPPRPRSAPVLGNNDDHLPYVCLGCDFTARGWATVERHARTEHGCARIEQPGLIP